MQLITHTIRQYTDALLALLPIGAAWDWLVGGFGDSLVMATSQELARLEPDMQAVVDDSIELHRPSTLSYTLADYQRVADAATMVISRRYLSVGSRVGYRCWSYNAARFTRFNLLSVLSHLQQPLAVGAHVGDLAWGHTSRYYLFITLDKSLIDYAHLIDVLMAFKQAHVYLYINDVPDLSQPGYYWDSPTWHWDDLIFRWY